MVGPSSNPHVSLYPWSWLKKNAYDPHPQQRAHSCEYVDCNPKDFSTYSQMTHLRKILWGSKIEQDPPSVAYTDVMHTGGKGLFKWLSNIVSLLRELQANLSHLIQDRFGFSFVTGVPATTQATEELTEKIGFIRETQCRFTVIL